MSNARAEGDVNSDGSELDELGEEELSQVVGGARRLIDCEGYAYLSSEALPTNKGPKLDGVVILSSSLPGGD